MLPRDVLVKIFSHLGTPREVVTCLTVCRFFADAASEPELWHEMAVLKYGATIADGTIHLYHDNWKSMVADDNKREFYKPHSLIWRRFGLLFMNCCIVTGVQWDRQNGKLRVYLDARGESNLQHPLGSSVRVRGDNGKERTYRAESWNEQVGMRGHYKGCLIFDESIFSREESNFPLCYACFSLSSSRRSSCRPIDLLPGNLGSFSFDRYTLNGSLYEDDTLEVELARWLDVSADKMLKMRGPRLYSKAIGRYEGPSSSWESWV